MACITNTVNKSSEADDVSFTPEPEALRIIRTVLFSLIAALALVGNYVVCRAVWRHKGTKPTAHYLVSNLAFAEIINMVCVVFMFHAYERPWSWELGSAMCKILPSLQLTSSLVITASLTILAVYRCVLLVKPMIPKPTPRQTCCVIFICWAGSIGLSFPAGHFRVLQSWGDQCEFGFCAEVFPEGFTHYLKAYSVVLFVINFALPFVIMVISYSLVRKKIGEHIIVIQRIRNEQSKVMSSLTRHSVCSEDPHVIQAGQAGHLKREQIELLNITQNKNAKNSNNLQSGMPYLNSEKLLPSSQVSNTADKNTLELENDIMKLVFVLLMIFIVCYIPYQVQFLLLEFRVKVFVYWPPRHIFRRLVFTLTCLPSALHPVCYGLMSRFYHKAFMRMIACRNHENQYV